MGKTDSVALSEYVTVKLPRALQPLVSECLFLSERLNELDGNAMPTRASQRVEAWEMILAEWRDTARHQLSYRYIKWFESAGDIETILERVGKLEALQRDGFRSVLSGRSMLNARDQIHVHHIIPKSYHGPERPENIHSARNLVTVTREEHDMIHAGWRDHAPKLFRAIGEEKAAAYIERTLKEAA